jgi:hypothetical protein
MGLPGDACLAASSSGASVLGKIVTAGIVNSERSIR